MADPIFSPTAAAVAAATSAVTLALFGVDHYSLLYAMVGAFFALGHAGKMGRVRSMVYVTLSTFAGAIIGNIANDYFGQKHKVVLFGACLVGGLIAQIAAALILSRAPKLIDGFLKRSSS